MIKPDKTCSNCLFVDMYRLINDIRESCNGHTVEGIPI